MRSINIAIAFLVAMTIGGKLSAETLTDRVQYLREVLASLHGSSTAAGAPISGDSLQAGLRCATPLILEAINLEEKYGNSLGLSDYFTRPSDSQFPETYDSPAGHFKIHYTTTGINESSLSYARIVAGIADSVWAHHIDQLGYHEPLNDGDYEWGGDSLYDIYILHLGSAYYGATFKEQGPQVGNGYQATSYMELQNDYSGFHGYEDRPLDALRVTVAHEFFHAIQFWYDAREEEDETVDNTNNASWLEMSSVWMEEETYDYINDYYYYLPSYIPYVHRSLKYWDPTSAYPYGAGLFPIYLTSRFGRDIMRDIWERCGQVPRANAWYGAIDGAIQEVSGGTMDFASAFAEYSRWIFFTGTRKPYFFEEAANYPMVPDTVLLGADILLPYVRYYSQFPAVVNRDYQYFPSYVAMNFMDFDVTTLDSGITVDNFFGNSSSPEPVGWRISVMGYNRFDPSQPVWVADSLYRNRDQIVVSKTPGVTDVVLVPVTANPFFNKVNNAYQFTVLGTTQRKDRTAFRAPYPNPFSLSDKENPLLTLEVVVSQDANVDAANHATAYLDVYTVAGERVYSTSQLGSRNGHIWLDWNGRNESGNQVASGVYVLLVRMDNDSQTFKALVVR